MSVEHLPLESCLGWVGFVSVHDRRFKQTKEAAQCLGGFEKFVVERQSDRSGTTTAVGTNRQAETTETHQGEC